MIRVLSIVHYPIFGGPHNRNAQVAPLLKSKGIETTVLLPDEPGNAAERLRNHGLDVVTIPLMRIRAKINPLYHMKLLVQFWGDVQRIRHIIRERSIDLVQINGLVNPQGAVAARLERVPVVWQILDTYSPMMLRRAVMPLVKWLAEVVMCTGRKVAEEHPGAVGFGDRLVLFYPPVNLKRFEPSQEQKQRAREIIGIPQDAFVVGNVGNINYQKGHGTFIRAAAQLKRKIPEARFVILGVLHDNHRNYAERLWQEAETLGLVKGVDLIVRDPGAEVAELEPAFDIFWMTSVPCSEGIPTVAEEAMALGIPVVATQVGSIAEIIIEGMSGYVVAPYDIDAMVDRTVHLYSDENMQQTMGNAAHDFALQNFSVESCAQSHCRAYQLALARDPNSHQSYC